MAKTINYSAFPDIQKYSNQESISPEILEKAFRVEKKYHDLLLAEKHFEKRVSLYNEFYSTVIPIYGRDDSNFGETNPKDKYADLFLSEIKGKRVADFGCGQGFMLQSLASKDPNCHLTGIDVLIPEELKIHPRINFIENNLLTYQPSEQFDIAISDNVIEHLVKEDAKAHLQTIFKSLSPGGKLILLMPNRLFGPADVTRIIDYSHSGKTPAQGGHVNESTYTEMIEILSEIGFQDFKTVLPIPKLKYTVFKKLRVGTRWITTIENSKVLLGLFRKFKIKGVCPIRFTVTLVCTK